MPHTRLARPNTDGMKTRVLFVCYGNTCRSVIAEHVARQRFGHVFDASSAGLHPQTAGDTIHALDALRQFGIDVPHHQPRAVRFADPNTFDLIVTMDAEVSGLFRESFPAIPPCRIEEWNVHDPWDNPTAYKACVETILTKLNALVDRDGGGQKATDITP
jgi:protein-tyrosine-phosphatase